MPILSNPFGALRRLNRPPLTSAYGEGRIVEIGDPCVFGDATAEQVYQYREGDTCYAQLVTCPVECRNGKYVLKEGRQCETSGEPVPIPCKGEGGESEIITS